LEYDYEVIHRKDVLHHVPDALSFMYEGDTNEDALAMMLLIWLPQKMGGLR